VLRGGSWLNRNYVARAGYRDSGNPSNRDDCYGFRILRPPSLESCGEDSDDE